MIYIYHDISRAFVVILNFLCSEDICFYYLQHIRGQLCQSLPITINIGLHRVNLSISNTSILPNCNVHIVLRLHSQRFKAMLHNNFLTKLDAILVPRRCFHGDVARRSVGHFTGNIYCNVPRFENGVFRRHVYHHAIGRDSSCVIAYICITANTGETIPPRILFIRTILLSKPDFICNDECGLVVVVEVVWRSTTTRRRRLRCISRRMLKLHEATNCTRADHK